ncbi:MAG: peptide chain release factor-like protein [Phycisphaerae bacterium]|jgi:hypothetical protein
MQPQPVDYLSLEDKALLAQCDLHVYKSSGPGGQHRNKVSSAVRLRHIPTQITAHGDDSRSQSENKQMALRRLRMNIACTLRRPIDPGASDLPPVVAECTFVARGGDSKGKRRLEVGRKDHRFWVVAAFLLDVLDHFAGQLSAAAAHLGISTGNFVGILQDNRHLLAAAQQIRKQHGQKPIL